MKPSPHSLALLLANPQHLAELSPSDWDWVIRHGRVAGLLGRLRAAAMDIRLLEDLPQNIRNHLDSAWLLAERQAEAARWEIERLYSILYPRGIPVVLLKGAAYVMTNSTVARGRTFNDIDILVPEKAIPDVERALAGDGWERKHVLPHDRRYYEEWMHEIPPMRHRKRKTTLDIHHTITPPIGRYPVNSQDLLDQAIAVPGWTELYTLCPEDQFLHAAAHLFLEAEFEMAYRDMIDLRLLYLEAASNGAFAEELEHRAEKLRLRVPLQLASKGLAKHFDVEIPQDTRRGVTDALFDQVLIPPHPDFQSFRQHLAVFLLYLRGHHLKLPARHLIPHLFYKTFLARRREEQDRKSREKNLADLRRMIGKQP